jgi:hypothetical protein
MNEKQEETKQNSEILDLMALVLQSHAFILEQMIGAGKEIPGPLKALFMSPEAVMKLCIAFSETDPSSKTRGLEALTKTVLHFGLYTTPAVSLVAATDLAYLAGKIDEYFVKGCNYATGSFAPYICPSSLPSNLLQLPENYLDSALDKIVRTTFHTVPSAIQEYMQSAVAQTLNKQYQKNNSKLTTDKVMETAGISSQIAQWHADGALTSEQAAMSLLLAHSKVYKILTATDNISTLSLLKPNIELIKSEATSYHKKLDDSLNSVKTQSKSSLNNIETDLKQNVNVSLLHNSLVTFPFVTKPAIDQPILPSTHESEHSIFSATMPGFVGISLFTGLQVNPYNIAAFAINSVVNNFLQELDNILHELIGRSKQDKEWSEHIGGVFDFTRGGWESDLFRHRLNQELCSTWLNPHTDGIPGKLGCCANSDQSTPGISHNTYFVSGYKHIFQVTGYADPGVNAYLYVRVEGRNLIWKTVKLPNTPGSIQVEFVPTGNGGGVVRGDVGVLIDNPKKGQTFRLDKMAVAPIDYPEKNLKNRQVLASIKSPIGGIYNFTTGGLCGFYESSLSKISMEQGKLQCRGATPESLKTTPGIIRPVNLIPGQKHILEVKGRTLGSGQGKAWLYVRDAKETYNAVALPQNESGTVQVEFIAPSQGKSLSTCDVGVLFSGQSADQSFELDYIVVAPVDCPQKEIDGHPIAIPGIKSPIGGIYNFAKGGLCGFYEGSLSKISMEQGKLRCRATPESLKTTPGIIRPVNLIPGQKHILEVKGKTLGSGQGKAWLYVRDAKETYNAVALPQNESGIVQVEFIAPSQGKSLSTCDVGVLFSGQSADQSFELDYIVVAPVDCLEKEISGHPIAVPGIKSPIGGIYNFVKGGLCGFAGGGARVKRDEATGELVCNVDTHDSTPGLERKVNLVPGQRHVMEVMGMSSGPNKAWLWVCVDGVHDYFRLKSLPQDKLGTVRMEFIAPNQGKPFSTCRMGILFSGPNASSCGQSLVLKQINVKAIDYSKDIEGHPVINTKSFESIINSSSFFGKNNNSDLSERNLAPNVLPVNNLSLK